jgi:DNA-binding beta-propeller fold protein YncE
LAEVPHREMGSTVKFTRLYVTCYLSGQVAEIDGDSGELLGTMLVGRGPLSIALNFGQQNGGIAVDPCVDPYLSDADAAARGVICPSAGQPDLRQHPPRPPSTPGPLGPRAYVTAYLDNAISVLDLDPRSPSYRRVVSRIGLPTPKQVQ